MARVTPTSGAGLRLPSPGGRLREKSGRHLSLSRAHAVGPDSPGRVGVPLPSTFRKAITPLAMKLMTLHHVSAYVMGRSAPSVPVNSCQMVRYCSPR